jgi:hypothetical protein
VPFLTCAESNCLTLAKRQQKELKQAQKQDNPSVKPMERSRVKRQVERLQKPLQTKLACTSERWLEEQLAKDLENKLVKLPEELQQSKPLRPWERQTRNSKKPYEPK